MNFVESVKTVLTVKYANFSGRASRSEFWWFQLFAIIVKLIGNIVDGVLVSSAHAQAVTESVMAQNVAVATPHLPILSLVIALALLVPSIAVSTRRLHDVNKSGWWLLLAFTIVGLIPLFIWYCKKSDEGSNRFGDSPAA